MLCMQRGINHQESRKICETCAKLTKHPKSEHQLKLNNKDTKPKSLDIVVVPFILGFQY